MASHARLGRRGAPYSHARPREDQISLDAMVQGVQTRFPGHRFRRTSAIDAPHDRVRFSWALAPQGGAALVTGTDVGVVAAAGRLPAITGFVDQTPASRSTPGPHRSRFDHRWALKTSEGPRRH